MINRPKIPWNELNAVRLAIDDYLFIGRGTTPSTVEISLSHQPAHVEYMPGGMFKVNFCLERGDVDTAVDGCCIVSTAPQVQDLSTIPE